MPRRPRVLSPSGIYHIMSRGIDKMEIYHDHQDRLRYIDNLLRVKKKFSYELYAFCLMSNHNHLLIKETDTEISKVMASINIRYSMYFNKKYSRVGSVFQERYRSEPIRSEPQLVVCARYIHNNPVKAGITKTPEEHRWSSYHDYLDGSGEPLLDTYLVLDMMDIDPVSARNRLIRFTRLPNDDSFAEYDDRPQDEEQERDVERLLRDNFDLELTDIKNMDYDRRCAIIAKVKADSGLTYKKLAQILDLTKDSIYRACQRQQVAKE